MSWTGIEAWARTNLPELVFLPPSSAADIAAAEETLGRALPGDLAAWWRQYGGVGDEYTRWEFVPPSWQPHSLREALHFRTLMIDAIRGIAFSSPDEEAAYEATALAEPAGTPCSDLWLPAWLPIAADGCGWELFVDLRGGPAHGCVMEWDKYGGAEGEPLWPNVTEMFDHALRALDSGGDNEHKLVFEHDSFYWE
ncbi:SMI1/KNR4 family protein [Lentzea sp. NPDC051213]|uniref:SMI1/KNR4 family protein n=1 Tax=Lentzea sp. NPDC051213 TaxID=3364126 RepID=UPI0037A5C174